MALKAGHAVMGKTLIDIIALKTDWSRFLSTWTDLFRLRNDLYCVEWGVKLYSLIPPERLYMLSFSEICEWLWKEPVRSRRKSAEIYNKCSISEFINLRN